MGNVKKTNWKHIKEDEFNKIKGLQGYGIKAQQVADITGRGASTIARVYTAEDWNAYRDILKKKAESQSKKNEKPVTVDELFGGAEIIEDDKPEHGYTPAMVEVLKKLDMIDKKITWVQEHAIINKGNRWFNK